MSLDTAGLFRAFRIKSLYLKKRFVMAPMTRNFAASSIPGEVDPAYYRRPAVRNEVGMPFFMATQL